MEQIWSQILVQKVIVSKWCKFQEDLCLLRKFSKSIICHSKTKMRKKSKFSDRAEMLVQSQFDAVELIFAYQMLAIYNG